MASQLEQIAELIPGIVWLMDVRAGRYTYMNPGAARILGWSSEEFLRGGVEFVLSILHPEDAPRVLAAHEADLRSLAGRPHAEQRAHVHRAEYRLRHKDGRWVWFASSGTAYSFTESGEILEVLGIGIDITRQKEAEAQSASAEKLASAGLLAAEIVHEINNPLSFVTMSLEMAIERLGSSKAGEISEMLGKAHKNAERISRIIRHLKTFSRVDDEEQGLVDVQEALESVLPLVQHELTEKATLIKEYRDLPPVIAAHAKLGQVFLNLLVNAAQAVEDSEVSRNQITVRAYRPSEAWVAVEFRDNGHGISPENIKSIFDPFFTTRPIGIGSGLGLSISQSIIRAFGGEIEVESQPGQGSVFRVLLRAGP